jgi:hypothetical protein
MYSIGALRYINLNVWLILKSFPQDSIMFLVKSIIEVHVHEPQIFICVSLEETTVQCFLHCMSVHSFLKIQIMFLAFSII